MIKDWRNWRLETRGEGYRRLTLAAPGKSQNTLTEAVLAEFEEALDRLESEAVRGVVLASGKKSGFLAGADIDEIARLDEAALSALIRRGHAALARFEDASYRKVAEINGLCFGGGLEIALACDARVATPAAQFALPEVRLGLHPGLGGLYRLPRTIPAARALSLLLTGKTIDARKAQKIGLIDEVVEKRHLDAAVCAALKRKSGPTVIQVIGKSLELSAPGRAVMTRTARRRTAHRVREAHYPAPYAILDLYRRHGGSRRLLEEEARSFVALAQTPAASNLIRLFQLRESLKRSARVDRPLGIERVHVIGAGAMGGDIAAWAALKGFDVTLEDVKLEAVGKALKRAHKLFLSRPDRSGELRRASDRLTPDPKGNGVRSADLIIEAGPEKMDVKTEIYAALSRRASPDALIATNTSSIPIEELAGHLREPGRLVGLHFFNPVAKMPLVEIVRGEKSQATAVKSAAAFAERIDKIPLPVRSAPGFLVNRVLTPYLLEAIRLVEEGCSPETVDEAMERFGMAQGPLTVADQVGLDICLDVGEAIANRLAGPGEPPEILVRKVKDGDLGKKTGAGFYSYKNGEPRRREPETSKLGEIQERLLAPLLDTSVTCLEEGVVDDEAALDAGIVFGAGFAPFRGGPASYIRHEPSSLARRARLEAAAQKVAAGASAA